MDMPLIRFNNEPTKTAEELWPCTWCWGKRVAMTKLRDAHGYPTCPDCAGRKHRTLGMPSFVVAHITGALQ